jgi:hypothetical protein
MLLFTPGFAPILFFDLKLFWSVALASAQFDLGTALAPVVGAPATDLSS